MNLSYQTASIGFGKIIKLTKISKLLHVGCQNISYCLNGWGGQKEWI